MRKPGLLATSALRSVAFTAAILVAAAPSLAQEVAEEQDPPASLQSEQEIESGESASGESIIVTGSRIRRPNLQSTVPVTSVGGEEFFQTGQTSVGDLLNELPALRTTIGQSNSTQFLGTSGLNLLDLRGLGTQRTLVLQNGRRHVGGDVLSTTTSVNTNTIPTDLIERVDIVTGGNSAIYGSDAIAGVVNFVLKQDFEGVQIRGQGGISKYGDAGQTYVSALAGMNFADGRGNVAINLEYAHQEDFYASGRPIYRTARGFVVVDTDPANATSDSEADRLFFVDTRSATYSNGGSFWSCCLTLDPSSPNVGDGGVFTIPYLFQRDGTLVLQTGERIGVGPFGTFVGGNGSNFNEGKQTGLSPQLDRYSANLIGRFEISPALVPFVEAKYSRTDSLGNASGPFFTSASGSNREVFFTDNPFLNPQARDIIRDYYGVTGADETGFALFRNVVELGNREETARRETYRIVGGVRGDFNDDWSYELSANYGRLEENTHLTGNVNLQRYLLSIDAVRAPGGNIVCRATIDPSARIAYELASDAAFAASTLAADVAGCVPINLFGEGNISEAAREYLTQDADVKGRITQFVLNGFVSGNTGGFELPGGPIDFVLGAEYRKEDVLYQQDQLLQSGLTFYNAIPDLDPPSFEVKEVFGEISIPILKDTPFFQELTLSAAGRIADYKGATGTVYAYNAGLTWSPIRDLRFRANYSRAVRAPNLGELFTELGTNFAPNFNDPCAADQIGSGSATRAANCAADGVPAGFDYAYTASLQFKSGGNPDITEETSDSYTIGGVFQPRFLPGLAISVDYYDITVDDVITAPSAQQLVDACYDAADINNQFCDAFDRAGPAGGPRSEIPGRILEDNLVLTGLNYAKLKVRGIDVEASYRTNIEGIGGLSTRFTYTRALQNDSFLNPVDAERADQILRELGDPRDAFNWNVDLKSGPVTFGYQMRYIGKMLIGGSNYENFFSKQGRAPENADYSDPAFYTDVFYHDVRLGYDVNEKFNFYLGIDDVTNRLPPFGSLAIGGNTLGDSGIFRNIGRFFYAGAVAKF